MTSTLTAAMGAGYRPLADTPDARRYRPMADTRRPSFAKFPPHTDHTANFDCTTTPNSHRYTPRVTDNFLAGPTPPPRTESPDTHDVANPLLDVAQRG